MNQQTERRRLQRRGRGTWAEYERRKWAWIRDNPDATPAQYDRAMRRLLDELRL